MPKTCIINIKLETPWQFTILLKIALKNKTVKWRSRYCAIGVADGYEEVMKAHLCGEAPRRRGSAVSGVHGINGAPARRWGKGRAVTSGQGQDCGSPRTQARVWRDLLLGLLHTNGKIDIYVENAEL